MPLLSSSNYKGLQSCLFWEFIKEEIGFSPESRSQEDMFPGWMLTFPTPLYTSIRVHTHTHSRTWPKCFGFMLLHSTNQRSGQIAILCVCIFVFGGGFVLFWGGWPLVRGQRLVRMLTRSPDVAFQKNTFLSSASVCLSCQDPLFCAQLSPHCTPLPSPPLRCLISNGYHSGWLQYWDRKKEKTLRIHIRLHSNLEKMCQMHSTVMCQVLPIPKLFLPKILSKEFSSLRLHKGGHDSWGLDSGRTGILFSLVV